MRRPKAEDLMGMRLCHLNAIGCAGWATRLASKKTLQTEKTIVF
jgi:hypothetical protein